MSFDTDIVKDGRGRCHKVNVSFDSFATIAHRWSDVSGVDTSNEYDNRIVNLSPLGRGLGQDHLLQVGTIDLELDNTDGGVDWMFDPASVSNLYKLRAQIYVGIYDDTLDASAIPAAIQWKQLGEFVFAEWPSRDAATVKMSLADDALGLLEHPCELPTLRDWYDQDASGTTNPLRAGLNGEAIWMFTPIDTAVPLAFGDDEIPCLELGIPIGAPAGALQKTRAFVVCCTTDTATVTSNDVFEVWASVLDQGFENGEQTDMSTRAQPVKLPQTFAYNQTTYTLWTVYKSATVTKGGKDFRILWVGIDKEAYFYFWVWRNENAPIGEAGIPSNSKYPVATDMFDPIMNSVGTLWVKGFPLSSRLVTTSNYQPAINVAYDLVAYYSRADPTLIDTDTFDRVKASFAYLPASGVIGVTGQSPDLTLRDHLIDIAQSFDFDLALGWDGKLRFSAPLIDYDAQTDSPLAVDETHISDVTETFPSREQRGAPFNRVWLERMRTSTLRGITAPSEGPFDDPNGTVGEWGKVIERTLNSSWRSVAFLEKDPWEYRALDTQMRAIVSFSMDWEGLLLELGDLFYFNWTRGSLGDPYTNAIFAVESITYDPGAGEDSKPVRVTAIWRDDMNTLRPYLLDDQTITRRVANSGGRTASVTDGSNTVTFNSGNLTSDGVETGDTLILQDSTEATTSFKRFKALKIASVASSASLRVDDPLDSFDFGTGGGAVAVAAWEIRRSHATYPTSASDPTNYPDGGNLYGRVSDADVEGVYSTNGTGGFTDGHKQYEG